MSALGIVSLILQAVGTALLLTGLYRRDPGAQTRVRAAFSRAGGQLRRLFRRPPRHQTIEVGAAISASSAMSAELSRRPGKRAPDASTDERLDWTERAVDLAFEEIDSERDSRRNADKELASRISEVERQQISDRDSLRDLIDQASVPERTEWWGAFLIVVGLMGSILDGILA